MATLNPWNLWAFVPFAGRQERCIPAGFAAGMYALSISMLLMAYAHNAEQK